jgi:chromosome segregation ATPase
LEERAQAQRSQEARKAAEDNTVKAAGQSRNAASSSQQPPVTPAQGTKGRISTGGTRIDPREATSNAVASQGTLSQPRALLDPSQRTAKARKYALASGSSPTVLSRNTSQPSVKQSGVNGDNVLDDESADALKKIQSILDEVRGNERESQARVKLQEDALDALRKELTDARENHRKAELEWHHRALPEALLEYKKTANIECANLRRDVDKQRQLARERAAELDKVKEQHDRQRQTDESRIRDLSTDLSQEQDRSSALELNSDLQVEAMDDLKKELAEVKDANRQLKLARNRDTASKAPETTDKSASQSQSSHGPKDDVLVRTLTKELEEAQQRIKVLEKSALPRSNNPKVARPHDRELSKEAGELKTTMASDSWTARISDVSRISEVCFLYGEAMYARNTAQRAADAAQQGWDKEVEISRGQKETITKLVRQAGIDARKVQDAEQKAEAAHLEADRASELQLRRARESIANEKATIIQLQSKLRQASEAAADKEAEWTAQEGIWESLAAERESDLKRAEEEIADLRETIRTTEARLTGLQAELAEETARADKTAREAAQTSNQRTAPDTGRSYDNRENARLRAMIKDMQRQLDEHNENDPVRQLFRPLLPKMPNAKGTEEHSTDNASASPAARQEGDRSRGFIEDTVMAGLHLLAATPTRP